MDNSAAEILNRLLASPWGPIAIFFLKIVDVTLATVRMLLLARNAKRLVAAIAFFEIGVWLFAIGSVIRNLYSIWHLLAYAFGFSAGNVVGLWIEDKLAIGYVTVHITTLRKNTGLAALLRSRGFGVTEFAGQGKDGPVDVMLTVVLRRDIETVLEEARRQIPDAFISVQEARWIERGWLFPRIQK